MSNQNQKQSTTVPEDPYILDIVSVTYGGTDITNTSRNQYAAYLAQFPTSKSFDFPRPSGYYGTILCAVWRNTIISADGEVVWSNFKSEAHDGDFQMITMTYDGTNDVPWAAPPPPSTGHYIVSAFWGNSDVTTTAQSIAASQSLNQYGITFNVSVAALGPDPDPTNNAKQFSVVYGNWVYPGAWTFDTAGGTGPTTGWTLELPVLFPPLKPPSVLQPLSYVTFKNSSTGVDMYPQIYGIDMSLAWDGRASNLLISNSE